MFLGIQLLSPASSIESLLSPCTRELDFLELIFLDNPASSSSSFPCSSSSLPPSSMWVLPPLPDRRRVDFGILAGVRFEARHLLAHLLQLAGMNEGRTESRKGRRNKQGRNERKANGRDEAGRQEGRMTDGRKEGMEDPFSPPLDWPYIGLLQHFTEIIQLFQTLFST